MGAQFLADSNAIIDLLLGRLPPLCAAWLDRRIETCSVRLSVINRIELLTKVEPVDEYVLMQQLIQSVDILPFDEPVVWETIKLRQGQQVKKLPDAIIAATAIAHNLVLITHNTSDFKHVAGLATLNLHKEEELAMLDLLDPA